MRSKKILTLVKNVNSVTINQLTLNGVHYYFWFTGEFLEDVPLKGKGKLYPSFEALWDAFAFDPFQVFPEISHPLPAEVREFLKARFLLKKQNRELHVFLTERWEQCLLHTAVANEMMI